LHGTHSFPSSPEDAAVRHAIDCFGLTDIGRERETNEDQFLIADLDKSMLLRQTSLPPHDHTRLFGPHQGHLFLVADGIGGTAGGRHASRLTTETLIQYVLTTMPWFFRLRQDEEHDMSEELRTALEACQRSIKDAQTADPGHGRMGTTLTMAYVLWPRLYVVHAGDSRAYLIRDETMHQLTRDHTLAQKLVDSGRLEPAEAEGSRWSNVLYNCIGGGRDDLNPDVYKVMLRVGDTLFLCSDGMTKVLSDERVAAVLRTAGAAKAAVTQLVAAANSGGGPDNITAIVVRFVEGQPAAP
jgi:serine/threonine protein phosphatase PrpC